MYFKLSLTRNYLLREEGEGGGWFIQMNPGRMALCKAYLLTAWCSAPLSIKHGPVTARGSCLCLGRGILLGGQSIHAHPPKPARCSTWLPALWAQLGLQHTCGLLHLRFPENNLITTCRQRTNAPEETGLWIVSYIPSACASLCQGTDVSGQTAQPRCEHQSMWTTSKIHSFHPIQEDLLGLC